MTCLLLSRLLKTAFKQSAFASRSRSAPISRRMSLSAAIDRARASPSPVLGDFDKENVTTFDKTDLYLASPIKSFSSPSKVSISFRRRENLEAKAFPS